MAKRDGGIRLPLTQPVPARVWDTFTAAERAAYLRGETVNTHADALHCACCSRTQPMHVCQHGEVCQNG